MTMPGTLLAGLLATTTIASTTSLAVADPDARAKAEAVYNEGQQSYAAGNFTAAAERFKAAYAIDPDPAYLFNIAQALREDRKCADSASYYHRFLDQVASAPNLDKVRGYLDEVEACARAQAPKEEPHTPPPPPVRTAPEHRGSTLQIAGAVVGGAGIVGLGIGAAFGWRAHSLQQDRENLCNGCTWDDAKSRQAADLDRRGHAAQTVMVVGVSAGGAAVIAGVVMYLVGAPSELEVTPTATGGTASTTWRF